MNLEFKKTFLCVIAYALLGFSEETRQTAYTFDMNVTRDMQIMAETLQGIVNRKAPRLFFLNSAKPYNRKWTEIYSEKYGIDFKHISSFQALVQQFKDEVEGVILYDPEIDGTRWLAVTVSGLRNTLPVPKGDKHFDSLNGLSVKEDFTERFKDSMEACEFALKNVYPECNRNLAHASGGGSVDGKYIGWGLLGVDYVVSQKGAVFSLGCVDKDIEAFGRTITGTPNQKKMYGRILEQLEQPALIFGYGEPELDWFDFVGQHGHTYLHWGDNLSFHAQVKAHQATFKQKLQITPADITTDKTKYYVAFMTSEGDTMKGPLTFFFDSWFDPVRGSIPMNWSIHPEMVRFPGILEYFYETATTNDLFVGVQVFNFDMKNLEGFSRNYADLLKKADMTVTIADYANPSEDLKQKERFLDWVNPLGAVDVFFEKSTQQSYNYSCGKQKIPVAATGVQMTYWFRMLPGGWGAKWQNMYQTPEGREQVIQAAVKEIQKDAAANMPPCLLVMYTDLHNFNRLPELHRDIIGQLSPDKFKAVRMDEGFSAMRK